MSGAGDSDEIQRTSPTGSLRRIVSSLSAMMKQPPEASGRQIGVCMDVSPQEGRSRSNRALVFPIFLSLRGEAQTRASGRSSRRRTQRRRCAR